MTTVFIGGSHRLARLNDIIRSRADNTMRQHFAVVIGDANGTDKAMQSYLASNGYRNVTVYCMGVSLPIAIRVFSALGGLLGGAMLGVLVLVLSMIFTDSTFGLSNILPGALVGAGVGATLGFCFPRVGVVLVRLFSNL